jgi:cytochrome-b5 reductase|eukprot:TRINITY_DN4304_c0_g1_i1.p1 TRINITY_DN4304_c0_g1~~TRINITY_DN4304_c0_g1_i1.p1  ORF type:complete len:303 (-),score=38.41 TRINITY_DN4304_c0_g1_i1:262-1089(-)
MASLSALVGPPTSALCGPGSCAFTEDWGVAKLAERCPLTHDTILLTFALQDETKPLGLSTCACILAKITEEGNPEPIVRPYTPVSTNALLGRFQLVVKVYEGGKLSQHMNTMDIGSDMEFKHIGKNVKVQYPFGKSHITMLVGGTGITPMIQALHAILGTSGDATKVSMIFGNKTQKDILCRELLEKWSDDFKDRFSIVHVLSDAADDETWSGPKGFIDRGLLEAQCAPPSEDVLVVVCGPPPMYTALCGPRDKPEELTGLLSDMGFSADQVYKF